METQEENTTRRNFDNLVLSLNKFEINYLEKEYIKTNGPDEVDYKDLDTWLFDKWREQNG